MGHSAETLGGHWIERQAGSAKARLHWKTVVIAAVVGEDRRTAVVQ